MKLIASGVTNSAARTRSPSFSRSSSSTRITILPAFSSAMISRVEASVMLGPSSGKSAYFTPRDAGASPARAVRRPVGCRASFRRRHHPFDVARDQIDLQIDLGARHEMLQRRDFDGVRNQVDREL